MKNIVFNKKYLEISIYALCVILLSILLGKLLWNIDGVGLGINKVLEFLGGLLSPFIYGFFIAYFINPTMRFLERVVFSRVDFFGKRPKVGRIAAVLITYLLYLGCLIWIISYLIPQIFDNISSLLAKLPREQKFYQDIFLRYFGGDSEISQFLTALNITLPTSYNLMELVNRVTEPILSGLNSLSNIVNAILTGTFNVANTILNLLLGLFISFYMLCDKEYYQGLMKRILAITFSKRVYDKIIAGCASSNRTIEKFIIGKAIDSLIIGIMLFVVLLIMKPPYPMLITVIVGVTNMIPYFGPIVGAVISTLIILPVSPELALWLLLVIFVLQQFDGAYLGPKILGDSMGLPPMLIILAILIGGAAAGPLGMFFGVPLMAIIRNLIAAPLRERYKRTANYPPDVKS
ncbi:MAG: AI-2E family transporter [Clostridiales bacterium]|jgi:predicted PurR-regulated permease PerM|nr:AI-2E family transporter [Clostridiales bacterium]